jgi:hypothetical protein
MLPYRRKKNQPTAKKGRVLPYGKQGPLLRRKKTEKNKKMQPLF